VKCGNIGARISLAQYCTVVYILLGQICVFLEFSGVGFGCFFGCFFRRDEEDGQDGGGVCCVGVDGV
jgi:hypothetical protein